MAWMPPSSAEGRGIYVIQSGDTLWDLAASKLGDGYMWPQIWAMNDYIEDAHWIYPGDPLVIVMPNVLTDMTSGIEEDLALGALQVPPVYEWDMHCTGFIRAGWMYPALRITSHREYMRKSLGEHDLIYLNQGANSGVQAGNEYFVVDKGSPVTGADTDATIGNVYTRKGRVKVLVALEDASIAQITHACDIMTPGMGLLPFEPIPIPFNVTKTESLPVYVAPNGKSIGRVVYGFDNTSTLGEHQVVYIDLGAGNDLFPGDRLLVYRDDPMGDSNTEIYWDLFRQTNQSTPDKDLFRYDNQGPVRRTFWGNTRTAPDEHAAASAPHGDSRLPSHVLAAVRCAARPTRAHTTGTAECPVIQGTARRYWYSGVFPRVFAEIVVLTTEDKTAACRVIFSETEIRRLRRGPVTRPRITKGPVQPAPFSF